MPNVTYTDDGTLVANFDPSAGEDGVAVFNNGDMAWTFMAGCLVMLMAPGVGFLYSGLLRRKNALSMLFLALAVYSVCAVEWMFWGYSLTFSSTGSSFIGDLKHFGLINVLDAPSPGSSKIPELLFCFFQGNNPIACWTWAPNGWGFQHGDLDFAGGGPVHISSGTAALMWSLYLGRRRGYGTQKLAYRPHSVSHVVLGTALIWFGWFGFNGGSELAMNLRSVQAGIVTNIAAAMGGLTWMFLDYIYTRKYSAVSLCSGILAGLVGITPAAGFVGAPAALAIGFLTAIASNYATGVKVLLKIDDAVDGFALHGVGGFVGAFLTGLFADTRVTSFDGYSAGGGWINHNYEQLGWQLASAVSAMAYAAVVTYLLLFIVDHIPGLSLRCSEDDEIIGLDEAHIGEHGYDFVSIRREIDDTDDSHAGLSRTPSHLSNEKQGAHLPASDALAPAPTAAPRAENNV
ncbi:hypothetical protein Rhopal_006599-T1 [Rhodotorula paludigena]|uniref:Ammonium transporter AmtB-like domain-containing protein n=1 Tax=Rhodotorula paludigena TaxID=86838 RepID=A0AAV5GVP7_9BASI|nr:hypothetical protein Rhopal_006599-T1 [Rhodotorula paludigena]